MMIIYRTIFILMDQVIQIYQAQVMRLGYSTVARIQYTPFHPCAGLPLLPAGIPVKI